ncbi:hypothetical protein HMPREF0495_00084 [Levilactobacillus brevis ATCC 14869 = DSM 20054]|uniref:Uncharacterized protein n=1 Tax=Levilactobacillus brevis ATCC 14869 = DSM 20054 TaxID=649758 RepID=U2PQI3_LEVBR|nr:hypothetical protein HMPREF0495_00084 [Levilactobacillus brevis ATCC 14869 = DSM 20054]
MISGNQHADDGRRALEYFKNITIKTLLTHCCNITKINVIFDLGEWIF